MNELNNRFANGHPSNTLHENGVLVRQFDRLSAIDGGMPWLPCPLDYWCGRFHAQWPASIINTNVRILYYPDTSGIIFDSSVIDIFCTYYGDGKSMARDCDGGYGDGTTCIPGCAPVGSQCLSTECSCWDCSFPPEHLADALQSQLNAGVLRHNEVIIDTRSAVMPDVVLAFFHMGADDGLQATRARFLESYGLGEDRAPIVRLDLQAARPFSWG